MSQFHKLDVSSLQQIDTVMIAPKDQRHSLDSPASDVMIDFRVAKPLVLEQSTSVVDALMVMKRAHVDVKLIIDKDGQFVGLTNRQTLEGPNVLATALSYATNRENLYVSDIMEPRSELRALTLQQVESSKIGDILETMREIGEQSILVVDSELEAICGIITAINIARLLHIPINIEQRAAVFSEIVKVLRH